MVTTIYLALIYVVIYGQLNFERTQLHKRVERIPPSSSRLSTSNTNEIMSRLATISHFGKRKVMAASNFLQNLQPYKELRSSNKSRLHSYHLCSLAVQLHEKSRTVQRLAQFILNYFNYFISARYPLLDHHSLLSASYDV